MPDTTAARAAVLDPLGLLAGIRGRLGRAPVRRGKADRRAVWREVLADRSAAAFPAGLRISSGRRRSGWPRSGTPYGL